MQTVCIAFAHGCMRAETEVSIFSEYFRTNGYKLEDKIENADLIVVVTCGFDSCAETVSLNLYRRTLKRKKDRAKVIVTGCLTGIVEYSKIVGISDSDVALIPPRSIEKFDEHIDCKARFMDVMNNSTLAHCFVATDVRLGKNQQHLISGLSESYNPTARKAFGPFDRLKAGFVLSKDNIDKFICRLSRCLKFEIVAQRQDMVPGILISRGCLGECTYCAIRLAAGPQVSLPLDSIVASFKTRLKQGNRIMSLVAADVGAYGQDIGLNCVDLFKGLFSLEGHFQLIINDFNPRWLIRYSDQLIPLFSKHKHNIDYIVMPVQSGSERILETMKRGYTILDVMAHFNQMTKEIPGLNIATHILVGFPGETDEDFQETLRFLKSYKFRYMQAFKYDDRPNTVASTLQDKVPEWTKRKRLFLLNLKVPSIMT